MIVLACGILGALWGGLLARRRDGKPLDIAQYAAGFGIVGLLLGLILTVILARTLGA